jgi:hypothetical protein
MFCDRSHQTVAFCLRINATYEVGLLVAVERPDVERRGRLAADAVVPCLCMLMMLLLFEVEDWREWEETEREWAAPAPGEAEAIELRKEVEE